MDATTVTVDDKNGNGKIDGKDIVTINTESSNPFAQFDWIKDKDAFLKGLVALAGNAGAIEDYKLFNYNGELPYEDADDDDDDWDKFYNDEDSDYHKYANIVDRYKKPNDADEASIAAEAAKDVEDALKEGSASVDEPDSKFDPKELSTGADVELEHTSDKDAAKEIAKDHLHEDPAYYKAKHWKEEAKENAEKFDDNNIAAQQYPKTERDDDSGHESKNTLRDFRMKNIISALTDKRF